MTSTSLVARLARIVWASPNTLLGLALGVLGVPFGARMRVAEGTLQVLRFPFLARACAVTFGHCVLYRRGTSPDDPARRYDRQGWQRLGDHERAHVRQYERWGPFFLVVYLLSALKPGIHWMERQADDWAGRFH